MRAAFGEVEVDVHPGAVSRLLPPRSTSRAVHHPQGRAGALGELLDADGAVLTAVDVTEWDGWLREVPGPAAALRIRTTCASTSPVATRSASAPSAGTGSRSVGRSCRPATAWSAPR